MIDGHTHFRAVRLATLGQLQWFLERSAQNWLIADLSLGAWIGQQVGREFVRQLADVSNFAQIMWGSPPGHPRPDGRYASIICQGIDAEAMGDSAIRTAHSLCRALLGAVRANTCFVVLAPRFGNEWGQDNIALLQFLRRELSDQELLLVFSDVAAPIPGSWKLEWTDPPAGESGGLDVAARGAALIPGVVASEVYDRARKTTGTAAPAWEVAPDCRVIAPEARCDPVTVPGDCDHLATVLEDYPWLKAYFQCFGNNLFVDVEFLCEQAWARFHEGCRDTSWRLLDRAASCSRNLIQYHVVQTHMQGMRIAALRFADAAACPPPGDAVPNNLRAFLLLAKGWGLTMSGKAAKGEAFLRQAQTLSLDEPGSQESLFAMNIRALARFGQGDSVTALELERRIEGTLRATSRPEAALQYVNYLNTARVLRRLGDLEAARDYYTRAFATSDGLCTESDLVHRSTCLARLAEQRDDHARALTHWIQTALYLVSASTPEAISRRVLRSIQKSADDDPFQAVDSVSVVLAGLLRSALRRADLPQIIGESAPLFTGASSGVAGMGSHRSLAAVGRSGWSVFVGHAVEAGQRVSMQFGTLRAALNAALRALCDCEELESASEIIVDTGWGYGIPECPREVIESSLRHGVSRIRFGELRWDLDDDMRRRLEQELLVRVGRGVAVIDEEGSLATVHFRRYRQPLQTMGATRTLLAALGDEPAVHVLAQRVSEPATSCFVTEFLRPLERQGVIQLVLPEKACTAAGIRLPTTATCVEI